MHLDCDPSDLLSAACILPRSPLCLPDNCPVSRAPTFQTAPWAPPTQPWGQGRLPASCSAQNNGTLIPHHRPRGGDRHPQGSWAIFSFSSLCALLRCHLQRKPVLPLLPVTLIPYLMRSHLHTCTPIDQWSHSTCQLTAALSVSPTKYNPP